MSLRVVFRGGGDLASGAAFRCAKAGWQVIVLELAQPLAVRRMVSFSQAVYDGHILIEGVVGKLVSAVSAVERVVEAGDIAVLVDPDFQLANTLAPDVVVDGRMAKKLIERSLASTPFEIGLGPGFIAGVNCHVVIETKRGANLGRVYWSGEAEEDTGDPEPVDGYGNQRVIRSPSSGRMEASARIGQFIKAGDRVASIDGCAVHALFDGVLRGLLPEGVNVVKNMKIGDLDPRNEPSICFRISDKALAVGGGVLEAILSMRDLRQKMCPGNMYD